tara:strand:- start:2260 stop:2541 length:282 start_codon:yes stop_codon:yes gene_type:complete
MTANLILLTEVYKLKTTQGQQRYSLREVFLNRDYVVSLRDDARMLDEFEKGYLPENLDEKQNFTKIVLSSGSTSSGVSVVGSVFSIAEKVGKK